MEVVCLSDRWGSQDLTVLSQEDIHFYFQAGLK